VLHAVTYKYELYVNIVKTPFHLVFQMVPQSTVGFVGHETFLGISCVFTTTMLHQGPRVNPEQMFPMLSHYYKGRGGHWPLERDCTVTRGNRNSTSPEGTCFLVATTSTI